ncbi:MAG TPA: hypothetical protein VI259_28320 [Gemmatimonadaceae bacterium]
MLVLPTINGTKAFGFAESGPGQGEVWVRGVLQFAPAEAVCVQDLVERGEPLSYSGPVWQNGRWTTDTFPIELIDVRSAVGAGVLVGFGAAESGTGS